MNKQLEQVTDFELTMIQLFLRVFNFQSAGKQDVAHHPRWVSQEDLDTSIALIREETEEIATALDTRNMPEVVDGIVDSFIVLSNLVNRLGIAYETCIALNKVLDNNDSKVWDKNGNNISVLKEAVDNKTGKTVFKIGKPEGYEPVRLDLVFPYLNYLSHEG